MNKQSVIIASAVVSCLLLSTQALARNGGNNLVSGKPTEINFSEYRDIYQAKPNDNKSVVLMKNTTLSDIVVTQGEAGWDHNLSVIDLDLQAPGSDNDVEVLQDGGFTQHRSLVTVKGTSGGNDINVDQKGVSNDSSIALSGDSDRNNKYKNLMVRGLDVKQNGKDNYSSISLTNSRDNGVYIDQDGNDNVSVVTLGNSDLNEIDVLQEGNRNDSKVELTSISDSNVIDVDQKGSNSVSGIYLTTSTNNESIQVMQTWSDFSHISMTNTHNSTVKVTQY